MNYAIGFALMVGIWLLGHLLTYLTGSRNLTMREDFAPSVCGFLCGIVYLKWFVQ